MGDPRNLSFSTRFNQPKILADDSRDVTIPVSVGTTPDTLFTITTNATTTPMPPRLYMEYNDELTQVYGDTTRMVATLGLSIIFYAYYNALNALVVQSLSTEVGTVDVKIHYRIYRDARPN